MARELSPFELDRELSHVAPKARAAYRAIRRGRDAHLKIPDVLTDEETLERLAQDASDPIAAPLLRYLYWLSLMRGALSREAARVRQYRLEFHALDTPLAGHFSWRELLGHALRDAARRPALLDVLFERGDDLRDAGSRLYELRAQQPAFGGVSREELERPCAEMTELALDFLKSTASANESLGVGSLADVLEQGLATEAADGWPRQLSLRSLHDLLGSADWLSGLRLETTELPASLSAASFLRGFLRLGAAWSDALATAQPPFCIAHDPFGLERATRGALFANMPLSAVFLQRQLGLGKSRAQAHARALGRSAFLFTRQLALRVLQAEPALAGPRALREAFLEHASSAFGFEVPPSAAGLLFRPRLGDAQRFCGVMLAAARAADLADDHDEDWFRNPRAIEQLRAEARTPPATTCTAERVRAGGRAWAASLTAQF